MKVETSNHRYFHEQRPFLSRVGVDRSDLLSEYNNISNWTDALFASVPRDRLDVKPGWKPPEANARPPERYQESLRADARQKS